jgi:ATP-dependent protease HslVU (ClpYQ) peptidase subunit
MSVVIGIKNGNKIVMASDSQITSGGVRKLGQGLNNFKIWHPDKKKDVLMGAVGSLREKNITQTNDDLIRADEYYEGKIDYKFVVNKLINRIYEGLKEAYCIDDKEKPLKMGAVYLFAFKNNLYEIDANGAVIEINKYTAIGSGANEALASLHTTEDEPIKERIKKAMKASCLNDIFVSEPIIVGDTSTIELHKLKEEKEEFDG